MMLAQEPPAAQSAIQHMTVSPVLSPVADNYSESVSGLVYDAADNSLQLQPAMTARSQEFISRPIAVPLQGVTPFLSVGSLWRISETITEQSGLRLSLRASTDGGQWQDWLTLDHLHYLADGRQYAHLVQFDSATRFVQIRIQWHNLTAPVSVRDVRLSFISPGASSAQMPPGSAGASSVPEGNQSLSVVSRTGWGCPDGQGSRWTPYYTTVTHLIVHHTATPNTSSDWAATVRAIWNYHAVTLGWGDIGYNYLIDPNGVIYEGRSGGDGSMGAHFSCANGNTMGVALLGNYSSVAPSASMMDSLERLLAEKSETFNLDPLATTYHASSRLTIPTISGHRDGNSMSVGCPSGTVCPGNVAYNLLPSIRSGTDARIEPGTGVDVNTDGRVTPVDAIYVLNRLNTTDSSADVNGDGSVTMDDVQAVLNALGQ
jgi:hypothetical protein